MACGGKGFDERITEALIKKVVEEQLKAIPLEDVPSLTPDAVVVQNEQEIEIVTEVSTVFQTIAVKVKNDPEIQERIKRIEQIIKRKGIPGAKMGIQAVFIQLVQGGITWEKIMISLYLVGIIVGIMVMPLCQFVSWILNWIKDFFQKNLLPWILGQGGWIRCVV